MKLTQKYLKSSKKKTNQAAVPVKTASSAQSCQFAHAARNNAGGQSKIHALKSRRCNDLVNEQESISAGPTIHGENNSCFMDQVCIAMCPEFQLKTVDGTATEDSDNKWWLEEMGEEIIYMAKTQVADTTRLIREAANSIEQMARVEGRDDVTLLEDEGTCLTEDKTVWTFETNYEDDNTCLSTNRTLGNKSIETATMFDDATYVTIDHNNEVLTRKKVPMEVNHHLYEL